jgi:regulator of protease activity HflC (stomatin/prohibitin superfamily)
MFTKIQIKLNERVVLFRDGLPFRALAPGRYVITHLGWRLSEMRWDTDTLVFSARPEVRALLPREWYGEVTLTSDQRAILFKDGAPKLFLRPGTHRYWTVDESVRIAVLSTKDAMPLMTNELAAIMPRDEYVDATVRENERGLLYVQGRLVRTLGPGRYTFWSNAEARASVTAVDMRSAQLTLAGQELMTRDKVTLRLTLTIEYAVEDAAVATHAVADVKDALYLIVQLASRDYVAGQTLDELLMSRDAMTQALMADALPKAARFGVRVDRVGVKDVVLPGEMKTLLNRVIEAEKEAQANVILRREEVAATRSLANTARVMAENPILLRLKELESMKEIATSIKEVRVVVGADGLKSLLPAHLLGDAVTKSQSEA